MILKCKIIHFQLKHMSPEPESAEIDAEIDKVLKIVNEEIRYALNTLGNHVNTGIKSIE